jgi:hypothetical protein
MGGVLKVTTEDGHPVTGKAVTFTSAGGGLTFTGSVVEQNGAETGQYYIPVRGDTPGTYGVMASIDGHPITDLGADITYAFGFPTIVQKTAPDEMNVTVQAAPHWLPVVRMKRTLLQKQPYGVMPVVMLNFRWRSGSRMITTILLPIFRLRSSWLGNSIVSFNST